MYLDLSICLVHNSVICDLSVMCTSLDDLEACSYSTLNSSNWGNIDIIHPQLLCFYPWQEEFIKVL